LKISWANKRIVTQILPARVFPLPLMAGIPAPNQPCGPSGNYYNPSGPTPSAVNAYIFLKINSPLPGERFEWV
jgi:hypothetical protein